MKNWILNSLLALVAVFGILLLHGCYPNESISVNQTDVVLTGHYDSVNFNEFSTYFISDTVYPVRDDTTDKSLIPANNLIISQIVSNMSNYGYTRIAEVDTANPPDLLLTAAAISVTTVTVGWWYPYYPGWGWGWYKSADASRGVDYWYGYPGYYPPGWGWGGVPYYSSYTTGTLLMEMANPDDTRVVDGEIVTPLYWAGAINGVLSSGNDNSRITRGIDQSFEQSPYLKTN